MNQTDDQRPELVATADFLDGHAAAQVINIQFRRWGTVKNIAGRAVTLKVFEDNALVRQTLSQPGAGKILVVDGGGSLRTALLGDQLATLAVNNGWSGVVINGAIRDSDVVGTLPLGVFARGTTPLKSAKLGVGETDCALELAGTTVRPGALIVADSDGICVL